MKTYDEYDSVEPILRQIEKLILVKISGNISYNVFVKIDEKTPADNFYFKRIKILIYSNITKY